MTSPAKNTARALVLVGLFAGDGRAQDLFPMDQELLGPTTGDFRQSGDLGIALSATPRKRALDRALPGLDGGALIGAQMRCIFIANLNIGGTASQTVNAGAITLNC